MENIFFTKYTRFLLFLTLLLFLQGFLFTNLFSALIGLTLLFFILYSKLTFHTEPIQPQLSRVILEPQVFTNHPIHVKTTIAHLPDSLHLKIHDQLPDHTQLTKGSNKQTIFTDDISQHILEYQLKFSSRGTHAFNHVTITYTDRWQLFSTTKTYHIPTRVTVHSDPVEIQKAKQVSTREHIELTIPSLFGTETYSDMDGIRTYQTGDRLKDIEWKASSRLQKMMTKLYEKRDIIQSTLLFDCSSSMRRTIGTQNKIDHASRLILHLTKLLQAQRHPVSLIAFDDHKLLSSTPPTYDHHQIFNALTSLPQHKHVKDNLQNQQTTKQSFSEQEQQFLQTIFPFLTQGKRRITHGTQASGIYEATRKILHHTTPQHVIIISDLETNLSSFFTSLTMLHKKHMIIWLLTPFTPYYRQDKKAITAEQAEELYKKQQQRELILKRLKKLNIEIMELSPSMQGIHVIETMRRTSR